MLIAENRLLATIPQRGLIQPPLGSKTETGRPTRSSRRMSLLQILYRAAIEQARWPSYHQGERSSPFKNRCRRPLAMAVGSTMRSSNSTHDSLGLRAIGPPGLMKPGSNWIVTRSVSQHAWNCAHYARQRESAPRPGVLEPLSASKRYDSVHHSALATSLSWPLLGKKDRLRAVFLCLPHRPETVCNTESFFGCPAQVAFRGHVTGSG